MGKTRIAANSPLDDELSHITVWVPYPTTIPKRYKCYMIATRRNKSSMAGSGNKCMLVDVVGCTTPHGLIHGKLRVAIKQSSKGLVYSSTCVLHAPNSSLTYVPNFMFGILTSHIRCRKRGNLKSIFCSLAPKCMTLPFTPISLKCCVACIASFGRTPH